MDKTIKNYAKIYKKALGQVCGICKLCHDEGCPELAKYLCRLDFVMADMMGMTLKRTQTIAAGADFCDFRYSRKKKR